MRLSKVSRTSLIAIFLACPLLAVHADDRDSERDSIVTIELPRPGFATNALTLQVLVRYRLEEHRRSSGDSHHRPLTLELWLDDALVGAYALPNNTDAGDHSFDVDVSKYPDGRVHLQADVAVNEKDEDSDEHRESRELRSRKIRVILDKTPPVLTLQSPQVDELFSDPAASVRGTVTDNLSGVASLSVNGLPVAIEDGAFQSTMPLPFDANALTVTATDRAGSIATIHRTVFHSPSATSTPTILSLPPAAALVGKLFKYEVRASSADIVHRVFSFSVAPQGMVIDPASGLISWTPAGNQVGDQPVTVVAGDAIGQASQSFTLSVFDAHPVTSTLVSAATGGSIIVNDPASSINGLSINIPAGALSSDSTLTVSELVVPPTLAGTSRFMLKGFVIDPDGTMLSAPATITVPYSTSEFKTNQGVPLEEFLSIYYLNPSTGGLSGLTSFSVDTVKHVITGTVPHFSSYVVTNAFRLCAPPTSQSDCPSATATPTQPSANLPTIVVHGYQSFSSTGMGDESTWGQLRYRLKSLDDTGAGHIDAWRFDWDSNLVSFGVPRSWFAETGGNLSRSINAVKLLSGHNQVNLLAHSFGGIAVRAYLQGAATTGGTSVPFIRDISKVMTLGTPHRGIGGNYATLPADQCALQPPIIQADTCFEANTGDPQSPVEGSFLRHLNTLPIPPSLAQFAVVRGQTLDLGRLVLNLNDGLITSEGSDFCGADAAISCGSGVVTDQTIATSLNDSVGLCHSPTLFVTYCALGLNVAMAKINDKMHPLWQKICTFLGGDPTKCKPQLKVTLSPAAPARGVVTSDTSNPGISCGTSCESAYDPGTTITLTAQPLSSNFIFSGWSGDCTGTGPCTVTMNDDKAVTASFTCVITGCGNGGHYDISDILHTGSSNPVVYAVGINKSGEVAGYFDYSTQASTQAVAFVVTSTGVRTNLGSLDPSGNAVATAINRLGQVVGYSCSLNFCGVQAFLYSQGKMLDLGMLPGSTCSVVHNYASAINDAGTVVGNSGCFNLPGGYIYPHAFMSIGGGPMTDLNNLIPQNSGWTLISALGINSGGQIIGNGQCSYDPQMQQCVPSTGQAGQSFAFRAFLYSAGTVTDLGNLGSASAINDSGTILVNPAPGLAATGLNNVGQIVGNSLNGPFIYDGAVHYLQNLIDPKAGVYLVSAKGINDAGQIVATGDIIQGGVATSYDLFVLTPAQ